jgi:SynChlorMet cassette radical SAM/SPASM protein ScmE
MDSCQVPIHWTSMTETLSAPLEVFLALTNRCNCSCTHCNVAPTKNQGELALGEWLEIIRELARVKVFRLWLSGGEPLMREDFFDLVSEIEKHHFFYGLNTNATLVTRDIARKLADLRRLTRIVVSLEGPHAGIHDHMRGTGAFEKAMTGLRHLTAHLENIETYTTVTRTNFRHIEEIILLALDIGVSSVKFNELLPLGQGFEQRAGLTLSNSERREVFSEVERLDQKYPDVIAGSYLEMGRFFKEFEDPKAAPNCAPGYLDSCRGGIQAVTIRPDGKVVPCDRLWDLIAGDLTRQSFKEIWFHSKALDDMRTRQSVCLSDISSCAGCEFMHLCTGGCPAVTYTLCDSLTQGDPLSCYRVYKSDGYPYEL